MVRLLAALALIACAALPARASGTARVMGLYPASAGAPQAAPLPMLDSKVEVVVRGPLVETVVTQRFSNRSERAIEATYIFPLPYDAAVSAMEIRTGARTIRAAIEKREEAQRRYEAAVTAGVSAAVVDQERPDVFTQTVTGIPANGTVEVVLRYDTLARYSSGTWQLVLPMVVAPRYVAGTVSGRPTTGTGRAPDTDRVPDASRVTPATGPQAGGPTKVAIHFAEAVTDVTSPTHELADTSAPDVAFTDPHSDHDAVIRWKATVPAAGWVEQGARGGFAAVIVEAPPAPARKAGSLRATFVLDRAATMRGDANIVAQPLVRALFGALTGGDRVAVIGAGAVPWSAPADALRAIEAAWLAPGGPLDLTLVLRAAKPDGAPLILVSDGLVADETAAIAAAKALRVPVHVIGVGPAPSRALLVQIAAVTGGTARFALPADDLAAIAKATVLDLATPPAPLAVTWGTLSASDVVPQVLPRLGAGQAMLVLARVAKVQTANARARGEVFAFEASAKSPAVTGTTTAAGALGRRWARMRLDELLLGRPDPTAVTRHALEYGLVSPFTSLVAIGTDIVVRGGTKHSVAVPVSAPGGMHWEDVKRETTLDFSATTGDTLKSEKPDAEKKKPKKQVAIDNTRPAQPTGGVVTGTTVAPTSSIDQGADRGGATKGAEDASDEDEADAMKDVAAAPSPMEAESVVLTTGSGSGYTVGRRSVLGRGWRASLALGGGLARQEAANRGLVATGLRLELARGRFLAGVEGDLWLVDGLNPQGRVLATFGRLGIARWFELGVGLGVHLGDGAGPAGSVSLRVHLPPIPWVSGYLRYDGALLGQPDGPREGQNTGTVGVEWGF